MKPKLQDVETTTTESLPHDPVFTITKDTQREYRRILEKVLELSQTNYCPGCGMSINGLDSLLDQAVREERSRIRKEVENIKLRVREHHGTFKYDDCYDDVLKLLQEEVSIHSSAESIQTPDFVTQEEVPAKPNKISKKVEGATSM